MGISFNVSFSFAGPTHEVKKLSLDGLQDDLISVEPFIGSNCLHYFYRKYADDFDMDSFIESKIQYWDGDLICNDMFFIGSINLYFHKRGVDICKWLDNFNSQDWSYQLRTSTDLPSIEIREKYFNIGEVKCEGEIYKSIFEPLTFKDRFLLNLKHVMGFN